MADIQEQFEGFEFPDPSILVDGELELKLKETHPYDPETGFVPDYLFEMVNTSTNAVMGTINLRVGLNDRLREFGGHIGYEVAEQFRGKRYAARSCRLLIPLMRQLAINPVVITCDPENIPSVKTIESLGAGLQVTKEVEIEPQVYRMTSIYHWLI
jgi:tagatose 1,6-diphosphate aldolase